MMHFDTNGWLLTRGQKHPSSILAWTTVEWKVLIGSFDYPTLLTLRQCLTFQCQWNIWNNSRTLQNCNAYAFLVLRPDNWSHLVFWFRRFFGRKSFCLLFALITRAELLQPPPAHLQHPMKPPHRLNEPVSPRWVGSTLAWDKQPRRNAQCITRAVYKTGSQFFLYKFWTLQASAEEEAGSAAPAGQLVLAETRVPTRCPEGTGKGISAESTGAVKRFTESELFGWLIWVSAACKVPSQVELCWWQKRHDSVSVGLCSHSSRLVNSNSNSSHRQRQ